MSAGEGRKCITHSKGVVMGRDHKAVYCLNPAGFAHSRPSETFNETHPVIFFFLSQVDRPHFSVAIFSASLFQLPRTQPKTRVNTRIKCDSVTTSKLGSFPLLFSSLYPLLPPSQGVPFPCVFFLYSRWNCKTGIETCNQTQMWCSTYRWMPPWATLHWGNSSKQAIWAPATAT